MRDAFGVEVISKAKGPGKGATYALRRLQRAYGGRVNHGSAQPATPVNTPAAQTVGNRTIPAGTPGPAFNPPNNAATAGKRPSKSQRKQAKASYKARQAAAPTRTPKNKPVRRRIDLSNPYLQGGLAAGALGGAGALGYTIYNDQKVPDPSRERWT